ncbi:hypothetical protein VP1G_06072 [Cytospora mali]|uniref:Uncharacterized protein n=1 Tax=Cytospora mali TaxID=578113 RepID=A0A194V4B0_CYTMA|nr:hypothetical protein VP1G_06072 [Valsa mali var. pyri (nom. inval.)]
MSPLTPRVSLIMLVNRNELDNDGTSCSNNAGGCLNTTGQFGVIFSIITVVTALAWIYWYTVIRPRKERDKRVDQDIEMDLGDGRTVIVSSGPYQRTVVFRGARSPSPPPPAYRPPTPGRGPAAPSGLELTTATSPSPRPSPRLPRNQVWPPPPGTASQTSRRTPRHPAQSSRPPGARSLQPGMPFQPQPAPMYPPQFMAPRPPPPLMMYPQSQPPLFALKVLFLHTHHLRPSQLQQQTIHSHQDQTTHDDRGSHLLVTHPPSKTRSPIATGLSHHQGAALRLGRPSATETDVDNATATVAEARVLGGLPLTDEIITAAVNGVAARVYLHHETGLRHLDSEMRSGLESLLERAERRRRAREAERLQSLVDRYDSEEHEAQADRSDVRGHYADIPPDAAGIAYGSTAPERARLATVQRDHRGDEENDTDDEESEAERPRRRVTFHQPSLDVLESRVGRRRRPSPPNDRRPTRQDIHHGESRMGHRRRTPSPGERIVERPMIHTPGKAESRIGRYNRGSPTGGDRPAPRRESTGFPGADDSHIGHRSYRRTQAPPPAEASSQGVGATYKSPPTAHGGHPTVDDGLLLNVPHTVGPPSSTGATCGNGSQASEGNSSDQRQGMGQYRHDGGSRGCHGPSQPGNEHGRRQWNVQSPEEAVDDDNDDTHHRKRKRGWVSKVASFLPTMARLATNNPVAREIAEEVAEAVTGVEDRARKRVAKSTGIHAHCHPVLFLALASDERLVTRMIVAHMTRAGEDHGRQGLQIIVPATADARARFPKSAQRACSSPLSTRLSISQKRRSGRRWTECAPEGVAQVAVRRMVQRMTMRRIEGGRGEAKRKSEGSLISA